MATKTSKPATVKTTVTAQQILKAWDALDKAEARNDSKRWTLAKLVNTYLAETKISQRALAEDLGKSQSHVFRMNKMWAAYGAAYESGELPKDDDGKPFTFSKLENLLAGNGKQGKPNKQTATEKSAGKGGDSDGSENVTEMPRELTQDDIFSNVASSARQLDDAHLERLIKELQELATMRHARQAA